jgi:hypothetical protein
MRRRRSSQSKAELVWDGRASQWPRGLDELVPGGDSNLWMCAQDAGTEVWAHFNRLERRFGRYDVEPLRLDTCSDKLRDLLIRSVPYNEGREDLSGAAANFATMVAQEFIINGLMPFEVQAGWNKSAETPGPEEIRLAFVYPESMTKLGRWLHQIVPRHESDESTESRVIRLDPERMVTFEPPRHYRQALAQMRSGFPLIGQLEHEWMMKAGTQQMHEDFKVVTRSYNGCRGRLSATIGWNGRGLFQDHIAEFHWVLRQLRWQRFCVEIRDAILTTLAEVFARIGEWRDESPRLVWGHLPTLEQVQHAESQIMGGGTRFSEVLKPFSLRSE